MELYFKIIFLSMLMNISHNHIVNYIKNHVIKFVNLKLKIKCHSFSNKRVSMHFLNKKTIPIYFSIKDYVVQFKFNAIFK